MDDKIVGSNIDYVMKAVKDQLNLFAIAIRKKNEEIKDLWEMVRDYQIKLEKCEKERFNLAGWKE